MMPLAYEVKGSQGGQVIFKGALVLPLCRICGEIDDSLIRSQPHCKQDNVCQTLKHNKCFYLLPEGNDQGEKETSSVFTGLVLPD